MEHFELCFEMPTIKCFGSCYHWTLNLEIIGNTKIIIKHYWNNDIVFVDCSKLIRTSTDRYTLTKVDGGDRE